MGKKPRSDSPVRITLDVLRAANGAPGSRDCSLRTFLVTLETEEQQVVMQAMKDGSIQSAAIARVLCARGWKHTRQVIERHRDEACRFCGDLRPENRK